MGLKFVGGPYHGMEIDPDQINRFGRVLPVNGDLGIRLFVLMPPRSAWDGITQGEEGKAEPVLPYEQQMGEGEVWFQESSPGVLEKTLSENKLKVHSRAKTALSALSQADRRRVIEAADALQHQDPARWSPERVIRLADDQPIYLLHVSPQLRAFIRRSDAGEIEISDIVREDTLQMFRNNHRGASVPG